MAILCHRMFSYRFHLMPRKKVIRLWIRTICKLLGLFYSFFTEMFFFRLTADLKKKKKFFIWSSINDHSSYNSTPERKKINNEKHRAQLSHKIKEKLFTTSGPANSWTSNSHILYSISFHLYMQLLHGRIQSSFLLLFCSYKTENPFSFFKSYHIVFQGKSINFDLSC